MTPRVLTHMSLLTAAALVLGYAEQQVPVAVALPGVKLGLSNTVLLYAIYLLDWKKTWYLMGLKVTLSGVLFAGFSGFLFSLAGGAVSVAMMLMIRRITTAGIVGVSVVGAVSHNMGQLLVATGIVQTGGLLLVYGPVLMVAGMVTGVLTGLLARQLIHIIHGSTYFAGSK